MNVRTRRFGLAVVFGAVPTMIMAAPHATAAVTGVSVEQLGRRTPYRVRLYGDRRGRRTGFRGR